MKHRRHAVSHRPVVGRIEDAARHHRAGARRRLARQGAALQGRRRQGARAAAAQGGGEDADESISAQATRTPDYGGDPHGGYGGVQFAAVAVDTETGIIKVERMVAVHDCGRVLNPLAVQSQVNGGILHGLSYALYEDRHMDRQTGRMVNANLDQYKIAMARARRREIEVILVEQYLGRNATDAQRHRRAGQHRRPRRPSPTPCTTPSACACGRCR